MRPLRHSGIGAGKTSGFRVGHKDRWEFLIAGDPMRQVAEAKALLELACNGIGGGVDVALATNMISVGLDITLIKDVTPVPHNGCRPPKQRRV